MITANQLRAARALLGVSQRELAEVSGVSVPTVRRMEASEGTVRANVDSLTKILAALNQLGLELLYDGEPGPSGGRGVRLRD
jgi:transcriptional regulator with XRE-family HTH domain